MSKNISDNGFNILKLLQYQRNEVVIIIFILNAKKQNKLSNKKHIPIFAGIMKRFFQILPLLLLLLSANLVAGNSKDSYSSTSMLSTGLWFRIAVTADGIYRIDYSKLKQLGLLNPSEPRIFGNNQGPLSYYNDDPKPDDLKEMSIFVNAGSDGIFNEGDYLLFYGQGTGKWIYNPDSGRYDYMHHEYSDTAFYFLTSGTAGSGKMMQVYNEPSQPATYFSSESDVLFVYEKDEENIIKSGREWFQQISSLHIDPGFKDLITSENIKYSIRVAARAPVTSGFGLYEGAALRKNIRVQGVNLYDYTGTYFQITDSAGSIPVTIRLTLHSSLNILTTVMPECVAGSTG